jgi:hypothetical protein
MKPLRPDLESMDESNPVVYYALHLEELVKGKENMIQLLSKVCTTLREENQTLNISIEGMSYKLEKLLLNKMNETGDEEEPPKNNVVNLFKNQGSKCDGET